MRIRTIKPEFWSSLTVAKLSHAERLQFIGLWNYADDEGRGADDPRLIKAAIWPLDDTVQVADVELFMQQLGELALVIRYVTTADRRLFQVAHWGEHQSISKPRPSILPAPSEGPPGTLSETSPWEGNGREQGTGKGMERISSTVLDRAFAAFWAVYPRRVGKIKAAEEFAKAARTGTDPDLIVAAAQRFRDDPNRTDEFTPHPSTWLHQGRWDDDPLPPRGGGKPVRDRAAEIARGARR